MSQKTTPQTVQSLHPQADVSEDQRATSVQAAVGNANDQAQLLSALPQTWDVQSRQTLWVDVLGKPDASTYQWLRAVLGLHPLALSDASQTRHPPKAEIFSDHSFLLFRGLAAHSHDIDYETIPIAIFTGPNWLVTIHQSDSPSVSKIWRQWLGHELSADMTTPRLACRILRAVVDRYTALLLGHEERMTQFEEEIFSAKDDRLLEELAYANARLKKLRRTHTYHASALETWQEAVDQGDPKLHHELNDVYEHYERLASMANLFQELTSDMMQSYMSLSAHRLNRIMQTLTVFTVLFLPLTLLTGIYGMNFEHMPELHWAWGYPALVAIMLCIVASTLWWFKRRKWW